MKAPFYVNWHWHIFYISALKQLLKKAMEVQPISHEYRMQQATLCGLKRDQKRVKLLHVTALRLDIRKKLQLNAFDNIMHKYRYKHY